MGNFKSDYLTTVKSVNLSVTGSLSSAISPLWRMSTALSGHPDVGTGWRKREHKESR